MIRGGRPKGRPPALILPGAAVSSVQTGGRDRKRGADDDSVGGRFGEGGRGQGVEAKGGEGSENGRNFVQRKKV